MILASQSARSSDRALNKRLNIQRRLAWSLCKDDTHNRREANPFFSFPTTHITNMVILKTNCSTNSRMLLNNYADESAIIMHGYMY